MVTARLASTEPTTGRIGPGWHVLHHFQDAAGGVRLGALLPVHRLPGLLADRERDSEVILLDDRPFRSFSPAMVDQILRPAMDGIIDAMRVLAEFGQGSDASGWSGSFERNSRPAAEDVLHQFLETVAAGQPMVERFLLRDLGRKHAWAGLPVSDLTGIFNRGSLACSRGMLRLHRSGVLPDHLLEQASDVVLAFTQELCCSAVEGYTEALGSAGTAVRSQRADLVRLLISGDPPARSEVQARADAVGWSLPKRLAVAVTLLGQECSRDISWPRDVLGAPYGTQWCLLLPTGGDQVRVPDLPKEVTAAVGPVVDWTDAGTSLEVAEHLLALATEDVVASPSGS